MARMDGRDDERARSQRPAQPGRSQQGESRARSGGSSGGANASNRPAPSGEPARGGLLRRYGGDAPGDPQADAREPRDANGVRRSTPSSRQSARDDQPRGERRSARDDASRSRGGYDDSAAYDTRQPAPRRGGLDGRMRGALGEFTRHAQRVGGSIRENLRRPNDDSRVPRHGEWRASDFDEGVLDSWDRRDEAPFELPPNPDDSFERPAFDGRGERSDRRRNAHTYDESRRYSAQYPADQTARGDRRSRWDDEEAGWEDGSWDAGWATGMWDTRWATSEQPDFDGWDAPAEREADGYWRAGGLAGGDAGGGSRGRDEWESNALDALDPSSTIAQLNAVGGSLGRVGRVRLLMRRRPKAALMLSFLLLGMFLTCFAPMIPLLRLGYDTADAARRVSNLQAIFTNGGASIFNPTKLQEAQLEINGLEHDLYEINSVVSTVGSPFAAVSPSLRSDQQLVRIGFDLTAAGDEGLQVAQTILKPIQGGALSSTAAGLTGDDIAQSRNLLADAQVRVYDALQAYQGLDISALPSPIQKYSKYFALLPTAYSAIGQMSALLNAVPSLLGIGQPAYYLVIAMDRSELRPGGGFQGNYGLLTLANGKQSKDKPLALQNVYPFDQQYYNKNVRDPQRCSSTGPQPPLYYWWWPFSDDDACRYGWGLRDANLSADFPTDARTDIEILEDGGGVPNNAPVQGVVAFTPTLIGDIIQVTGGSLTIQYGDKKVTVTPENLEHEIHEYQLGAAGREGPPSGDRKEFTHLLSVALLQKVQSAHGDTLKAVLNAVEKALKEKDLQLYLSDPRAELILQQLDLASQVHSGSGDGFFAVDANQGGNKANQFVTEHDTDVVTLLPDGGALHQTQISVTYDKQGSVYNDNTNPDEYYNAFQRVYMPGDATIMGVSGYWPKNSIDLSPCAPGSALITACNNPAHVVNGLYVNSDVQGRTMVMGSVIVRCGPNENNFAYNSVFADQPTCDSHPVKHTENIYITWYTPHAYSVDAQGHGSYTELVERQAGANENLTVYVDTSRSAAPKDPIITVVKYNPQAADAQFAKLIPGKKKAFDGALLSNQTVAVAW